MEVNMGPQESKVIKISTENRVSGVETRLDVIERQLNRIDDKLDKHAEQERKVLLGVVTTLVGMAVWVIQELIGKI
jgi:hypothetical protein